jgi:hypothetical protein
MGETTIRFLKLISFIVNEEKSLLIYFVWIVINGSLQDQLLYARYLFQGNGTLAQFMLHLLYCSHYWAWSKDCRQK